MAPKVIAGHDDARRHLLEEGTRSYPEAMMAIVTFEREIQKKCRELLERYIEDYADALQPPGELTGKEIEGYLWPATEKFDGSYRAVGATIHGKRFEPSVRWWGTYCTLEWEEQKCYASIAEWIGGPRSKSEQFFQRLRMLGVEVYDDNKKAGLYHDDKNVGICQALRAEEAGRFEEPLERLLQQWIELWKKVGGMKNVFK
jgi:hypothetical protein